MKEWFTARELAEFSIPEIPNAIKNIIEKASRENWHSRPRSGRGGGREYHISNLPVEARVELAKKSIRKIELPFEVAPVKASVDLVVLEDSLARYSSLSERSKARAGAKIEILEALERFQKQSSVAMTNAQYLFANAYNNKELELPEFLYAHIPTVCPASLRNWAVDFKNQGISKLGGSYGNRKGQTIIDKNEDVKELVLGLIAHNPTVSSATVMSGIRSMIFDVSKHPSYRTLQRWMEKWKQENERMLAFYVNPDKARGKYMAAFGSASESITRLNQRWELDGTPTDIMLADGKRYALTGCIDIYSRRLKLYVSPTATSDAVMAVMRRAIMNWGVPESVKTDNGKDYISVQSKSAFSALGIEQIVCNPFNPQEKPHIERVFNTFSHGLLTLLDGYIGHNVAARQGIESRRSFADRLFKKDPEKNMMNIVELRLTPEQLQIFCDKWCEQVYAYNEHRGLGCTPSEKALSYKGEIRFIQNERALDVLLSKHVERTVNKKGISWNSTFYIAPELSIYVGLPVTIFQDETDIGVLYVFDVDGKFICRAESPELYNISKAEVAAKARQISRHIDAAGRKEIKSAKRRINIRDIQVAILDQRAEAAVLSKPSSYPALTFETAAIKQAVIAATSNEAPVPAPISETETRAMEKIKEANNIVQMPLSEEFYWLRWQDLNRRVLEGEALNEEEAFIFESYMESHEFRYKMLRKKQVEEKKAAVL